MPQITSSTRLPQLTAPAAFLQVNDAPIPIASWGPSKMLGISRIHVPNDAGTVMEITNLTRRSHGRAFGILQGQAQFLGERLHGRAAAFPLALRLETEVTDAAAPRRNHAPDRAGISSLGVLLIEPPDDVWCDTDESPQGRRALDAVLPAIPRAAVYQCDLFEVVHEELSHVLIEIRFVLRTERVGGKKLLQFLRERRLRDTAGSYAKQFYLTGER